MKKIILIIITITFYCRPFAQIPIYDSTRVYDIVTDADTSFYLFPPDKPCITPGEYGFAPPMVMVQEYVSTDTVTVYGVAIPLRNTCESRWTIADTNSNYRAMLMTRVGPSPFNTSAYSMNLVDTVTLNRSHPRFCWFKYEDTCKHNIFNAPCYEFYFDTPLQINRMVDTFYVGRDWTDLNGCYIAVH